MQSSEYIPYEEMSKVFSAYENKFDSKSKLKNYTFEDATIDSETQEKQPEIKKENNSKRLIKIFKINFDFKN